MTETTLHLRDEADHGEVVARSRTIERVIAPEDPQVMLDLQDCVLIGADLGGLDLEGSRLERTEFRACSLAAVRLGDTAISGCSFIECDLTGLDMVSSNIRATTIVQSKGAAMNLYGGSIKGLTITESSLRGSRFANISMSGTAFRDCDLRDTRFEVLNVEDEFDIVGSQIDGSYGLGLVRNLLVDGVQAQVISDWLLEHQGIRIDQTPTDG